MHKISQLQKFIPKSISNFRKRPKSTKADFQINYFFIPLPEPIDLPDGYTFRLTDFPDPIINQPLLSETVDGITKYFSMSLVVHQMESKLDTTRLEASIEAILNASPNIQRPKKSKKELGLKSKVSVIEAACVVDTNEIDHLSGTFDSAIETIRQLQRSVYSVTQRPSRLVHMRNLPLFIPYMTRNVDMQNSNDGWPDNFELFMVNPTDTTSQTFEPSVIESDDLPLVMTAWNSVSSGLFTAFIEMRREAMYAYRTGNNITAMLLIGAACETFLREISLILWWEEGMSPTEVSTLIRHDTINPTINTILPSKLGGSWNQNRTGVLKQWRVKIANKRNQVIHAGYSPSDIEIQEAFDTYQDLETFVGDLLASKLRRYPVSASVFLGNKGLLRRGKMELWKRVTANLDVPVEVAQHFGRWKKELQRIENNGPFTSTPESCALYTVVYPNKTYTWWLVDSEKKLGCRAKQPKEFDKKAFDELTKEKDIIAPVSVRFEDLTSSPLETPIKWFELYKFLPLFEIHRWPFSYYDR